MGHFFLISSELAQKHLPPFSYYFNDPDLLDIILLFTYFGSEELELMRNGTIYIYFRCEWYHIYSSKKDGTILQGRGARGTIARGWRRWDNIKKGWKEPSGRKTQKSTYGPIGVSIRAQKCTNCTRNVLIRARIVHEYSQLVHDCVHFVHECVQKDTPKGRSPLDVHRSVFLCTKRHESCTFVHVSCTNSVNSYTNVHDSCTFTYK